MSYRKLYQGEGEAMISEIQLFYCLVKRLK